MNSSSKSVENAAARALGRITARDRNLLQLLLEHDVFTTSQVSQLAFTGQRRTNQRLAQLADLRVLDRVRPYSTIGSNPYHWLLGTVGAYIAAADAGVDPAVSARRRQAAHDLVRGMRRIHHVGCNNIFTDLIGASRKPQSAGQLDVWWSARRCAREWDAIVRPDGYGIWTVASTGRRLPFLVEYDTGTESLDRLAAKLSGYARLTAAAGHPTWLLFAFTSIRRENHARTALQLPAAQLRLPIATAALTPPGTAHGLPDISRPAGWATPPTSGEGSAAQQPATDAAGSVWRPLLELEGRALGELPDPDRMTRGAEPAVPTPQHHAPRWDDR